MNKFTLKYNALLGFDLSNVRPSVQFGEWDLSRKAEFHLTIINFKTQTRVKDLGYSMEAVGQVIENFLSVNNTTMKFTSEKAIVLHRTPTERIPHEEVSVVRNIGKEDWMELLIQILNTEFKGIGFPKIYPHVTTHSLNGFGIAVQSTEDISRYNVGRLPLEMV